MMNTPLSLAELTAMPSDALAARIETIRRRLGTTITILGHHYQKAEVLRHCDSIGDSFQLSVAAAESVAWRAVVFCGVHFMAETADILVNTAQKRQHRLAEHTDEYVPVVLPDLKAGCPMAEMATEEQVQECWNTLSDLVDLSDVVPITYVNSSAALKAFCGRHGGLACTSTNAEAVLRWAFERKGDRGKVLFFPDQHLGRNTALAMGVPSERLVLWSPDKSPGLIDVDALQQSRVVLWDGYCCVHQHFLPEQIDAVRKAYPGIRVIVHPECRHDVVAKADEFGSTARIIATVTDSPPGSAWAIGTEWHLVERLAAEYPDRTIVNLAAAPAICETMDLTTPAKLCRSLEMIESASPENVIRVEEKTAADALLALQRMLACR